MEVWGEDEGEREGSSSLKGEPSRGCRLVSDISDARKSPEVGGVGFDGLDRGESRYIESALFGIAHGQKKSWCAAESS